VEGYAAANGQTAANGTHGARVLTCGPGGPLGEKRVFEFPILRGVFRGGKRAFEKPILKVNEPQLIAL